jgi:hypothetical protein
MVVKRKQFRDLSPAGKLSATVAIGVSVALVALAERDLHRRSPTELWGDKRVWQMVCLNAVGAVAYFRWGRRRPVRSRNVG